MSCTELIGIDGDDSASSGGKSTFRLQDWAGQLSMGVYHYWCMVYDNFVLGYECVVMIVIAHEYYVMIGHFVRHTHTGIL